MKRTVQPEENEVDSSPRPLPLWWGCLACVLYFIVAAAATRSTFFGDTREYVSDIAGALEGRTPFVSLLDFGHLVWRPIGVILTASAGSLSTRDLKVHIATNLILVNMLASIACVLALWVLLRSIAGMRIFPAALACAAMLTSNGFIILSRSGTAWLPGLACELMACCFAIYASRRNAMWMELCAALLAACGALLWIPYALATPTVACASLLAGRRGSETTKRAFWRSLRIVTVAALFTIVAYLLAIHARHITSPAEFLAWMRNAAHGEGRNKQLLRMFFGLPRSFLISGDDGVLWKQFLFHDPYAGVRVADVLQASLWRVAVFYAVVAAALFELLRLGWKRNNTIARGILFWFAIAAVPTLVLAVAFEAGSVERYLALYGAFFVVLAWIVSQPQATTVARVIIVSFCSVLIVNNLYSNWRPRVDRERAQTLARLGPLKASSAHPLIIFTTNVRDELLGLYDPNSRAFDSLPEFSLIIPATSGDSAHWKNLVVKRALAAWEQGGEVWISKRCWAQRPLRQWLWVEGDDYHVQWKDIPQFVSRFQLDFDISGPDGFYRLANTSVNRETAHAVTAAE